MDNLEYLKLFISSKDIEGCSKKTLKYYKEIIEKVLNTINKKVSKITTDDLRLYLSNYKEKSKCSGSSLDTIRRVLSSFFDWLEDEDYILKSPVRRIHRIKTEQVVKEVLSDEDMEKLRENCPTIRELAIVDMLYSTGIRVGELVNINISDINFQERSCIVLGKGNKEREVYFDAKAKLHLEEYLKNRTDNNSALFVAKIKPYQRLSISQIEYLMRKLGEICKIHKVHPHKFRRSCATLAIDKGMPIEQVKQLLGHTKIDTTMHYAQVKQENVKYSHRKYIG